ncbi:MAG: DUF58 domain-containing protein [Candidatus Woesearchaeota archaeon]
MPDTKEILKRVKRLELYSKHLVVGLVAGAYHSVFKGRGVEFDEVREYIPGDDIRTIDWNVTARMNCPFVKRFIEERDLIVHIAIDFSASSEFGSIKQKKDFAIEVAVSIMLAALRNNDNCSLLIFTDKVEKYLQPKKGRRHILKLIREMICFSPKGSRTDINSAVTFLNSVARRRGIVFIISDFISELNYLKALKILKTRHDIVLIGINDVREEDIPDIGYVMLEDAETEENALVNTSDPVFRQRYRDLVDQHILSFKTAMIKLGIDFIQLKPTEDFAFSLYRFFKRRVK